MSIYLCLLFIYSYFTILGYLFLAIYPSITSLAVPSAGKENLLMSKRPSPSFSQNMLKKVKNWKDHNQICLKFFLMKFAWSGLRQAFEQPDCQYSFIITLPRTIKITNLHQNTRCHLLMHLSTSYFCKHIYLLW